MLKYRLKFMLELRLIILVAGPGPAMHMMVEPWLTFALMLSMNATARRS